MQLKADNTSLYGFFLILIIFIIEKNMLCKQRACAAWYVLLKVHTLSVFR